MKNSPLFFFAIFAALAASWGGVVLDGSRQLSRLQPQFDALDSLHFPQKTPGLASQGLEVYKSLGCASCHTLQVRRPGLGHDLARGWGERQSVARDYLFLSNPPLGNMRRGPDLANFGERAPKAGLDRDKLLLQLYSGAPGMPAYAFLFDEKPVVGAPLPAAMKVKTSPGKQMLPSTRAEALVAFLLLQKQDYLYPEAQPLVAVEAAKK